MFTVTPQQVLAALKTKFDMGELEMLAFGLGIPFEDLGGSGRSGKALAMLQYSQRHGKYNDLVQAIVDSHAEVDWDGALPSTTNSKSTASNQEQTQPTQIIHNYGTLITGDTNTTVGGDNIAGDKTGGNKTNIRDITDSSGMALGEGASADVSTQTTNQEASSKQDPTSQTVNQYTFNGSVVGAAFDGGTVNAENIAGGDITIGTKEEFQTQLATLEALIQEAIANHEIPADEVSDVYDDVQDATKEIAKESPSAKRLTSRLEYVQEVLEKSTEMATAVGKVGSAVLKAIPIVAGLVKAASILF